MLFSLAGDFGFDPLGLAEDPASLRWYVQAELVHCRFAMLGVFGILVTDKRLHNKLIEFNQTIVKWRCYYHHHGRMVLMMLLRVTGINKIPVWFEAGAVKYDFANTKTLFLVQLLLMGFVETKRYMDFVSPGSQAKEGSFFGLEASLKGLEPGPLRVLLFSSRKYSMNYVAWAYP
ncbi:Photosystem I chlorophyll a/b-binding protein 5, chloroplastic [Glycine max]|nr:Photosystem I chlorophyll a/b-binding protein 5, chloroplastic [Glycine max]